MPGYDLVRGHLVHIQEVLLGILECVVVTQRRDQFWAPWCIYLHDCLAARRLSGCMVAFTLFCDEVQRCVGVFNDWHIAKHELFLEMEASGVSTFADLAD